MGHNNELLWHLPGDLPRFKALTMGSPIIMGRKTFDSIGRALPGRLNIVLTANKDWHADGVSVASSIDSALELAETELAETESTKTELTKSTSTDKIFVIGGGQIYKLFLAYATTLEITEVADAPVADTYFPNFSGGDFKQTARKSITDTSPTFDYVTYRRI
jgi:dihydrofolate reductase